MNTNHIDWVLFGSSTAYMDGRSVYYLRAPGKASVRVTLTLMPHEYMELRTYLIENFNLDSD